MTIESINVCWEMSTPINELDSFKWENFTPSLEKNEIETTLDWPRGSIETLEKALSLKLARATKWTSIENNKESYLKAAKVYKRGVPTEESRKEINSGQYDINLCIDEESLKEKLNNHGILIIDKNVYSNWDYIFSDISLRHMGQLW